MKTMDAMERLESEVRGYCRSFPVVFQKGKGSLLFDEEGEEYIDFLSGAGTLSYGHNNPRLKKAVMDYLEEDGIVHGLDLFTSAKRTFLETFEERLLIPRGLDYKIQFPGPTGTNAVEAAFKLARKITGRANIVSFTNGFHGMTLGSVSATGNSYYRDGAGVPLTYTTFMPYDGYQGEDIDTLDLFRKMLEDQSSGIDLPAAAIVETVQGEGGVNVASFEWLCGLRKLCKDFDVLMIVDDIQVGCGRTGSFFSFERPGVEPDMVLLSKSLSGLGLPFSLVLLKPELDQWKPGEHNGTFRGNNLAFISSAEMIRTYWSDDTFEKEIRRKADFVAERLKKLCKTFGKADLELRGRGMIAGIQCTPSELGSKVSAAAFKRGLVIETSGSENDVLKLLPPLTIDDALLETGIDLLEASFADALDGYEVKETASGPGGNGQEQGFLIRELVGAYE
jgi:diaminobutyrate-2-oxoglutarate transaminase